MFNAALKGRVDRFKRQARFQAQIVTNTHDITFIQRL